MPSVRDLAIGPKAYGRSRPTTAPWLAKSGMTARLLENLGLTFAIRSRKQLASEKAEWTGF